MSAPELATTPRRGGPRPVKQFKAPEKSLEDLDAEMVGRLIAAAADVALVLDAEGKIRDLAFGSEELSAEWNRQWLGKRWVDTVTAESRSKIEALLREAAASGEPRWRQVNHPSPRGVDVPVVYSAVRVGAGDRVVAVGRDLRALATLQQRLIEVQQSVERDYARLRHVETRYRLLFQMTAEAVLIVDGATQKVIEANPAAGRLLGMPEGRLAGRVFPDGFELRGGEAIRTLLAAVRATGRADEVRARLAAGGRELAVSAFLFRQESTPLFAVRLVPVAAEIEGAAIPKAKAKLLQVAEHAPDAIVVTTTEGRIVAVNAAFLDLAQLATEEQARGESLDRWLGRPGVDLNVLVANLRQHGSVRLFATQLRGEYGTTTDIELSAVALSDGDEACFGFTIRNVGRRLAPDARVRRELPRSVEQLTELVGRVPLKELVRETTDVIERLCIEAALELTGDNRASAAEILGLSRQSLYVKLRRYGLGDLAPEEGEGG